jgi:hypothetical protein
MWAQGFIYSSATVCSQGFILDVFYGRCKGDLDMTGKKRGDSSPQLSTIKKEAIKMKTRKITGIFLCLLMVAMAFAVVLPMSISAGAPDKEVPFKGGFDGSTVPRVDPNLERIVVFGQANQLGKFTAVIETDMIPGSDLNIYDYSGYPSVLATLSTTTTFFAANGDELYADLVLDGTLNLAIGNFPEYDLAGTITGGTGRFDGATGSFSGTGGQTSVPGEDNDLNSGTFAGTISTVGSNK